MSESKVTPIRGGLVTTYAEAKAEQERQDRNARALGTAAALRELARWVERHPEVIEGLKIEPSIYVRGSAEQFAQATKALADGGTVRKDAGLESYFSVIRTFGKAPGALELEAWTTRETVCSRRQVGVRTETRQEPVEMREVEVEVPVYEWDCEPVLATEGKGD